MSNSALIPADYRLSGLTFAYDGAIDSHNGCPKCNGTMGWYKLEPFGEPRVMECEECELLCDCETEQVWIHVTEEAVPRHPMVIAGALRERIEKYISVNGRTHGYNRLDELVDELERALTYRQFEDSLKFSQASRRREDAVL